MDIICINGPINSGKSTVGRRLAGLLPGAVFIEGDDHGAPEDADLDTVIAIALARIEALIASATGDLVIAYPLRWQDHARLAAAAGRRGARLFVATLAPPMAVALADRGGRPLSAAERDRIVEMYAEGYAGPAFSDLVLDNAGLTPDQTASAIAAALAGPRG
jgi:ABC-type multidrug transport system fused ATPase/permease subunit